MSAKQKNGNGNGIGAATLPGANPYIYEQTAQDNGTLIDIEMQRELVRQCRDGDPSAYSRIFNVYGVRIYNFCVRITGNPDDAAEATQEAFCRMLDNLDRLDLKTINVYSYLFIMARNLAFDLVKKRKRFLPQEEIRQPERQVDLEVDPERSTLHGDMSEAMAAAHERLPQHYRAVLALRELEDMSYEEIAGVMGQNSNAIAQLISRARLKLRDELRQQSLVKTPKQRGCKRIVPLLSRHIDGRLNTKESSLVEDHLDRCDSCRTNLEGIYEAGTTYRSWLPLPLTALALKRISDAVAANASEKAAAAAGAGGAAIATKGIFGYLGGKMGLSLAVKSGVLVGAASLATGIALVAGPSQPAYDGKGKAREFKGSRVALVSDGRQEKAKSSQGKTDKPSTGNKSALSKEEADGTKSDTNTSSPSSPRPSGGNPNTPAKKSSSSTPVKTNSSVEVTGVGQKSNPAGSQNGDSDTGAPVDTGPGSDTCTYPPDC